MKNEDALRLLIDFAGASSHDTVLDVACGPGIVVCAFADVVEHATGIDLTPAMIERARLLQAEKGLDNITWQVGDIVPLPCPDCSFSIVTSRYAFHHLEAPQAALSEMKRVCRVGGKVLLIDQVASAIPEEAEALNRMERLRDPSHVRSLTLEELRERSASVGLSSPRVGYYTVEVELETLLRGSFPNKGDGEKVRQMIMESLDHGGMGVKIRRVNGKVIFSYPIAVLMAERQDD